MALEFLEAPEDYQACSRLFLFLDKRSLEFLEAPEDYQVCSGLFFLKKWPLEIFGKAWHEHIWYGTDHKSTAHKYLGYESSQIRAELLQVASFNHGLKGRSRTQQMVKDSTGSQGLNAWSIRLLEIGR